MTLQPVLIDGHWRPAREPAGSFRSVDPASGQVLPDEYPVSGLDDAEEALRAGRAAAVELRRRPPDALSDFLEAFVANLEASRATLVDMAHYETALPRQPRLYSIELPRAIGQLRQAAAAARDRSWCLATIDTALDIRAKYAPLGRPVVVFGPANFPLAFNACSGGDLAAAIAAGNPVIAKAHPGHPGTTRLLAEAALEALQAAGLPPATVQMMYDLRPEDGLRLASHPLTGALAFTGSRASGLRLKEAADRAGTPVYLEMSSVNPVVVLPGALDERLEAIAEEFASSCTLGCGQFCTNPGLVLLLQSKAAEAFFDLAKHLFAQRPAGPLLGEQVRWNAEAAIERLTSAGAEVMAGGGSPDDPGFRFENTLLRVEGARFLTQPYVLQAEAFGPISLCVFVDGTDQLTEILSRLEGNLTGSIYSHSSGGDDALVDSIEPLLRERVGRLLNDKMPTGVAVTSAMHHGGPYPATGHPGFTSVGLPASMLRFAARQAYDNVRSQRLPAELRDRNPTGRMWRLVDGVWTQSDVKPPRS